MSSSQPLTAEEEEKRKKRLARNRESARECRRRKKAKQVSLKQQIAQVEAENLQLRLKLQMESESLNYDGECAEITNRLESMINESASEATIMKELAELQERYSDYGRDRRSAINFHMVHLKKCLRPTHVTQSLLWLLSVAAKKPTGSGSKNSKCTDLYSGLLASLQLSSEQVRKVDDLANSEILPELNSASERSDAMLGRLSELVSEKNDSLDSEMNELGKILSARQIAKFILWIDQNPVCMQMLEALWPHMTSKGSGVGGSKHSDSFGTEDSGTEDDADADADAEHDSKYGSSSEETGARKK